MKVNNIFAQCMTSIGHQIIEFPYNQRNVEFCKLNGRTYSIVYDIYDQVIKLEPWWFDEISYIVITMESDEWYKICRENGLEINIRIYGE